MVKMVVYELSDATFTLPGVVERMSRDEAEAMGCTIKRVVHDAGAHSGNPLVRYLDGAVGSREKAEAEGFTVKPMPAKLRASIEAERAADIDKARAKRTSRAKIAKPVATKQEPEPELSSEYGQALMSLDEAKIRPAAAKQLLEMHNEKTLPLFQAEALLSALPAESYSNNEAKPMTEYRDPKTEAIVARAAELRQGFLSVRGARGDTEARAEAIKLGSALTAHRAGKPIAAALHESGVDIAAVAALAKTAHR